MASSERITPSVLTFVMLEFPAVVRSETTAPLLRHLRTDAGCRPFSSTSPSDPVGCQTLGLFGQDKTARQRPLLCRLNFGPATLALLIFSAAVTSARQPQSHLLVNLDHIYPSTSNTLVHSRCWLCHAVSPAWHLIYQFQARPSLNCDNTPIGPTLLSFGWHTHSLGCCSHKAVSLLIPIAARPLRPVPCGSPPAAHPPQHSALLPLRNLHLAPLDLSLDQDAGFCPLQSELTSTPLLRKTS